MFEPFFHVEVWCFLLQNCHVLALRRSEALCFDPVQMKHNFFSESVGLRSDTYSTALHLLDLCYSFSK